MAGYESWRAYMFLNPTDFVRIAVPLAVSAVAFGLLAVALYRR